MSFRDLFKTDNSIKTTEEHYKYFNSVKESNMKDDIDKRNQLLNEAKIPKEFLKYVKFNNDNKIYMEIPYLKYTMYVYYWKNRVVFDYHYSAEYSFEEIMKCAIGKNEVKVK